MKRIEDTLDFNEMVSEIEAEQILLPYFQRRFTWSSKEVQRKLAASVLCRMPIGSILLLDLPVKEYGVRRIGCNDMKDVNIDREDEQRAFLLDGQQRVTVMVNLFSDYIHEGERTRIDSLKRRGFLGIAKAANRELYANDYWGLKFLRFPLSDPEKEELDFLTEDIEESIFLEDFAQNKPSPYNPYNGESDDELRKYCLGNEAFYRIPLYLLVSRQKKSVRHNNRRLLQNILKDIATSQGGYLAKEYEALETEAEKRVWLTAFCGEEEEAARCLADSQSLEAVMRDRQEDWAKDMESYLYSCLSRMHLQVMGIPHSKQGKAIEIFENMNRGGVKLSTFDLVMARAARENHEFGKALEAECDRDREYPIGNVPERIRGYCQKYIEQKRAEHEKHSYSVLYDMNCIDKKGEYTKIFQDAFLNVLSLQCHNRRGNSSRRYREEMGREQILNLTSREINENYARCCKALSDAAFFLKARCGIRSITEINYRLMYTVLAFLFLEDEAADSPKVWDLLNAWYWNVIFSGSYNRDQNTQAARDMAQLQEIILRGKDTNHYVRNLHEKAWKASDFSEKKFLLSGGTRETDNAPKETLGQYICQFYLAEGYYDILQDKRGEKIFLCAFSPESDTGKLEKHHLIPTGSFQNLREEKRQLQREECPNRIVSSPLNMVYVTAGTNKRIAACDLRSYLQYVQPAARELLGFPDSLEFQDQESIAKILCIRLNRLEGTLQDKTNRWLEAWEE